MIDYSKDLVKLDFKNFKKWFARFEGKESRSAEEVYKSIGGKLPRKSKKKESL